MLLMVPWIGSVMIIPLTLAFLILGWVYCTTFCVCLFAFSYFGPPIGGKPKQSILNFINASLTSAFKSISFTLEGGEIPATAYTGEKPIIAAYHPHGALMESVCSC